MTFFNKMESPPLTRKEKIAPNTPPKEIRTILGEDALFEGVLSFDGAVRIDGKLKGEIISKGTLLVGEKSVIEADIKVDSIIIGGKVLGNIIATSRMEMLSNSEISGNIQTPFLKIEEGAIFLGACKMHKPDYETKSISYVEEKKPEVAIQHPVDSKGAEKVKAVEADAAKRQSG